MLNWLRPFVLKHDILAAFARQFRSGYSYVALSARALVVVEVDGDCIRIADLRGVLHVLARVLRPHRLVQLRV